jgi:hypothetical protein
VASPADSRTGSASPEAHAVSVAAADPVDVVETLQGASRTTGGIFCGRANGNMVNMGDMLHSDNGAKFQTLGPLESNVLVFNSCDTNTKPIMTIDHLVTLKLEPILKELGRKYSPTKSMSIFYPETTIC